ncbi:hypothetical protein AHAS_Ahas04G0229200 [Arachis hypogaea]
MVLSPPAGIVGAVAIFSSPIPSHLSSSRHHRTKEALTPWHNRHEAAIEAKQVAAQEAERAKFVVEKAEQNKRSAVIRAQGEAKSAQLIGQAIANNPAFIILRKIEAAREITHTISNSANKVYLNSDDLFIAT